MTPRQTQSKHWCFTINNWSDEEQSRLRDLAESHDVVYIIWGREVGANGNRHLQGFLSFNGRKRFNQVKDLFLGNPHLERARGTPAQAADYCKKDGDFDEHGTVPVGQGHRSDIDELVSWCRDRTALPSRHEVIREFPGLTMTRGIDRIMQVVEAHVDWAPLVTGEPVLRSWQEELFGKIEEPASDRTIDFYVDTEGGKGKTWFTHYCIDKLPGVQYMSCGKAADLAHIIDPSNRVFLFDIPRSQMEFLQYQLLEMLKNRLVFSPKYASVNKRLSVVPHVVVFCNEEPDMHKLSADRYNVVDI